MKLSNSKCKICSGIWHNSPLHNVLDSSSSRVPTATGMNILSNISNTRKSVSLDIQTLSSRLKEGGSAEFFNELEVFE